MNEVVFKNVEGHAVPLQPWPQTFYISRNLLERDAVEVRPLTAIGLIKGVTRNFVTMTFWRFCITLRKLGLLNTKEFERFHWRQLNATPWRHAQLWRFKWVRALQSFWDHGWAKQ
jgi:hypothetical protein